MCHLVHVMCTKAHDPSHETILTGIDRKARDDSLVGHMFGIAEMQLRIGGRPVTDEKMEELAKQYPLIESIIHMCRTITAF